MQNRFRVLFILVSMLGLLVFHQPARAADSQNVNLVGELAGGLPRDVAIQGDYAYVAASGILSILDISNPTSPSQIAYYDTPGGAWGVAVSGNHAYVGCSGGLRVINISTRPQHRLKQAIMTPRDMPMVWQ